MAISGSQLETWSHIGAQAQSAATYRTIKSILEHKDAPFGHRNFEIFLQGSYGNDTNIYAESDVDIVICLTEAYHSDISGIDAADKAAYDSNRIPASYGLKEFKAEVFSWLKANFGGGVSLGKKAIFVPGSNSRRDADVVVCIEHHRLLSYRSPSENRRHIGITFLTSDGDRIINFPKQHMQNCTTKHQSTSSRFKPNIRIMKNMRNAMIADGFLRDAVAPSYFLEGMIWNVPDENFTSDFQQTFENNMAWLERCNPTQLACANDLHWLIRDGAKVCWNTANFVEFVASARRYWNSGRR